MRNHGRIAREAHAPKVYRVQEGRRQARLAGICVGNQDVFAETTMVEKEANLVCVLKKEPYPIENEREVAISNESGVCLQHLYHIRSGF